MVTFDDLDEALETLRNTEYPTPRKEILEAIFKMDNSLSDFEQIVDECKTGSEEKQLVLDKVHELVNKELQDSDISNIEDLFREVTMFCLSKTQTIIIEKWLTLCTDYDEASYLCDILENESWPKEDEELIKQLLTQARDRSIALCNDFEQIIEIIENESDQEKLKQLFKRWSELCTDNDDAETSYDRLSTNESDENISFMIEHWMKLCDEIYKAQSAYQIGYDSDDENLKKAAVYRMHELYEKGVVAEPSGGGIY